jgi:hypothetical protein
MQRWLFIFFALAFSACAAPAQSSPQSGPTPASKASNLPDLGAAPELAGDTWLNAPAPLRLADLRGKVVLVDMWTFG